MPSLRCPSCCYATSVKKSEINNAVCSYCDFDLFNYYYTGREKSYIDTFIAEENTRLKKEKAKRDRANPAQPEVLAASQSKTKKIVTITGGVLAIIFAARLLGVEDYIDEYKAEKAGFASVYAYEQAAAAGFDNAEAYKLHKRMLKGGFSDVASMEAAEARGFNNASIFAKADALGIQTATEYKRHLKMVEAKSLGFETIAEMDDAKSKGFSNAARMNEAKNLGLKTYAELKEHEEMVKRNKSCVYNWKACSDNKDLVNNYQGITSAKSRCERAVEKGAKFGTPDWGGWLRSSFGTFYTGNHYIENGTVTLIEPNVKLQNGFGAMVKSEVECIYDLKRGEVLSWRVTK